SMHPCHLTDPADCKALVELTLATFGRVDVLFNLAARQHFNRLEDITDEENATLSVKVVPSLSHTTNKAGIIGMTRQLAMEGAEHGIRVNSISPGLIETNASRDQLEDPEWASYMLGRTLLGR